MEKRGFKIIVRGIDRCSTGSAEALYSFFIPDSDLDDCRRFDCRYRRPNHRLSGAGRCIPMEGYRVCSTPEYFYPSFTTIGSKLYALNQHKQLFAVDFAHSDSTTCWTQLRSPPLYFVKSRAEPTLLNFNGSIYLCGVTDSHAEEPLAVVCDPENCSWSVSTQIDDDNVISCECVVSKSMSVWEFRDNAKWVLPSFDLSDLTYRSDFMNREEAGDDLVVHWNNISNNRVTFVKERDSVYWISRFGHFCSYNVRNGHFDHGPIIGVGDDIMRLFPEDEIFLPMIHLEDDMFCLIHYSYTRLHCMVCRVVEPDVFGGFALMLVGCFFHCLSDMKKLRDVFLVANPPKEQSSSGDDE